MGIRDNRIDLGWVRTNGSGDIATLARANQDNTGEVKLFGGGNRVGVFVLTRDGPGRVRHRPGDERRIDARAVNAMRWN